MDDIFILCLSGEEGRSSSESAEEQVPKNPNSQDFSCAAAANSTSSLGGWPGLRGIPNRLSPASGSRQPPIPLRLHEDWPVVHRPATREEGFKRAILYQFMELLLTRRQSVLWTEF